MTESSAESRTCPKCGSPSTGKFCSHCGAPMAANVCGNCQAPLSPGARFCHVCGTSIGAAGRTRSTNALPWAIAAAAVVVVVLVLVVNISSGRPPAANQAPGQAGGAPAIPAPDISSMTPRQQADRLFARIMTAAEAGDTASVAFHTEMALQAYAMLGAPDADTRYHMGLIHVVRGERDAALAQADSMDMEVPGHLLASALREAAYRAAGDTEELQGVYQAFLRNYDREAASQRPEYAAHQNTIDSLLVEARRASGGVQN